jgi:putative ABC transport system permease protein
MRSLRQIAQITLINLRSLPQRPGTSLVIVVGIAGVVGVLVSVLAMAEGFRHTLASTGRPGRVIRPACWPRCPPSRAARAGARSPPRSWS